MKLISKRRGEHGNQLIELALILPILLLMALLVGEGAQVLRAHMVINNAAREGARLAAQKENYCPAATNPAACISAIQTAVVNYAANNGVAIAAGEVTVDQTSAAMTILAAPVNLRGTQVTVAHPFPLAFLPPFLDAFFVPPKAPPTAPSVTLVGQAEFQIMLD